MIGCAAALFTGLAGIGHATQLISNGSFEQTTLTNSGYLTSSDLTGWTTNSGYTFVVFPGTATTNLGNGITLWPGISNTIPASSPDGGNFIAADGAYQTGSYTLQQTINNLTVGHTYQVSFWQAGAQQSGFSGPTTDQWQVSLFAGANDQVQNAPLMTDASHDFTGWQQASVEFTATAASETLQFFAIGTPSGVPPFALLDGVSMSDVPEPATLALMAAGLIGVALARRQWQRRSGASGNPVI